jgi:hypothetical protein
VPAEPPMNVRARGAWEAVDLGFVLGRVVWWDVVRGWFFVAAPIGVIAFFALGKHREFAWVVVWFLKPVLDRMALALLGRVAVGERPKWTVALRELPSLFFRHGWKDLTYRRFSPMRSFLQPIHQLEGISGRQQNERIALLGRTEAIPASGLLFSSSVFEGLIWFGFYLFVWLLIPWEWNQDLRIAALGIGGSAVTLTAYVLSLFVVEPFYVASGFTLYLNRRVHLEGWDVERSLRPIAERLAKTAALLFFTCLVLGSSSAAAESSERTGEEIRRVTEEVLSSPDFGHEEKVKDWVLRERKAEPEKENKAPDFINAGEWLAQGFPWFLGFALAGSVGYILWNERRRWLPRWPEANVSAERATVESLHSAPAEPMIPDDFPAAARNAFSGGDARLALSLLYRGALGWLSRTYAVSFPDGATETECVERVRQKAPPLSRDFAQVTTLWQAVAYASRLPSAEEFDRICSSWARLRSGANP